MAKTKQTPKKSQSKASQPDRLLCPFCPKTFEDKEERNRHIIECTDSRMFCEFCNYNTNKRAYLNKHLRKMHCSAKSTDISDIDTDVPDDEEKNEDNNRDDDVVEVRKDDKDGASGKQSARGNEGKESEIEEGELTDKREVVAGSKDLFESISSAESEGEVSEKDRNMNVIGQQKDSVQPDMPPKRSLDEETVLPSPKRREIEEGRVVRKRTLPSIITPERSGSYISDLRKKLTRGAAIMAPKYTSTPVSEPFVRPVAPNAGNTASTSKHGDNEQPRMKTKYIKIITKYVENGKRMKIIEKKVPV